MFYSIVIFFVNFKNMHNHIHDNICSVWILNVFLKYQNYYYYF